MSDSLLCSEWLVEASSHLLKFIMIHRDRETVENFERLIRSVLIREDQPAVVILGHFSPQMHHNVGFGGPEVWHNIVAQFYDVPHVR